MKYKYYLSDFEQFSTRNIVVSYCSVNGLKIPLFNGSFYFIDRPYNDAPHFSIPNYAGPYDDPSPLYSVPYFKFFEYDNTIFFTSFPRNFDGTSNSFFKLEYVSKNSPIYGYGILNPNKYYLYVSFLNGSFSIVTDFSDYDLDIFLVKCAEYFSKTDNIVSMSVICVSSFEVVNSDYVNIFVIYTFNNNFGPLLYPSCCVLDYTPIIKLLGGIPV